MAGKGQTDPKQLLLNHWFSRRLLTAAGDILGTDMGADPRLCVCLMIAGSRGKDPPFEPGVCFSCTDLQPPIPANFLGAAYEHTDNSAPESWHAEAEGRGI